MKTIEIKSKDGEILLAESIGEMDTDNDIFEVSSSDFLVESSHDGLKLKVTNAVNGWGNNCRELFEGAKIDIY